MQASPLKSLIYFMENAAENRFQEPISIDKYAAGERHSDLIDLSKVTQIPLSFIIATEDEECLASYGEDIFDDFSGAEEKYI